MFGVPVGLRRGMHQPRTRFTLQFRSGHWAGRRRIIDLLRQPRVMPSFAYLLATSPRRPRQPNDVGRPTLRRTGITLGGLCRFPLPTQPFHRVVMTSTRPHPGFLIRHRTNRGQGSRHASVPQQPTPHTSSQVSRSPSHSASSPHQPSSAPSPRSRQCPAQRSSHDDFSQSDIQLELSRRAIAADHRRVRRCRPEHHLAIPFGRFNYTAEYGFAAREPERRRP